MDYSSLSCDELVRTCAESGNAEAWEEFVRRFERLIGLVIWGIVRRYGEKNNTIVKDLIQETFAKICDYDCRLLREFKPHHQDAFFGMLRVTAANVTRDHFRARNSSKRGSGKADSELKDPELLVTPHSGSDHIERRILLEEIDRMLRVVCSNERDREIFWLHHRQGFTASDIAKIGCYALSAKGVESILHRLKSQLRTRLVELAPTANVVSGTEGVQGGKSLSKGEGQS